LKLIEAGKINPSFVVTHPPAVPACRSEPVCAQKSAEKNLRIAPTGYVIEAQKNGVFRKSAARV
jgi:hypothetical protein